MARRKKKVAEEPGEAEETPAAPQRYSVRLLADKSGVCRFLEWRDGLRDAAARTRITARIFRILYDSNFGDHRERIRGAVSEMRIDHGPGYCVYYVRMGDTIVVLLGGGTKARQLADVAAALALWEANKDDADRFSRHFGE